MLSPHPGMHVMTTSLAALCLPLVLWPLLVPPRTPTETVRLMALAATLLIATCLLTPGLLAGQLNMMQAVGALAT